MRLGCNQKVRVLDEKEDNVKERFGSVNCGNNTSTRTGVLCTSAGRNLVWE